MYYQNYEDYMRSVLGYPVQNQDAYPMNYFENTQGCIMSYQNTKELEDCYPEIYRIVNPIVCEVCDKYNNTITRDMLENMVEEIYQRIEINNEIAIKINIDNRNVEKEVENRGNNAKINTIRNLNNEQLRKTPEIENRQRRPNNPLLRDLIRILILNRLLGGNSPNRPSRPRPPVRPPFLRETRIENENYEKYYKL